MVKHDVPDEPTLAEIVASIRRATRMDINQDPPGDFQLPAIFRPQDPATPAPAPTPLVERLSASLRNFAVASSPSAVAAPPRTSPLVTQPPPEATTAVERPPQERPAQAPAAPALHTQVEAARRLLHPPEPLSAMVHGSVRPRFQVLMTEYALHRINDEEFVNGLSQLLAIAAAHTFDTSTRMSAPPPDLPPVAPSRPPSEPSLSNIEDILAQLLRPMLRDWITENLSHMVHRVLAAELSRLTAQQDHGEVQAPSHAMPGPRPNN